LNSVERLVHYAESLPRESASTLPTDPKATEWPVGGEIEFQNVSVYYPTRPEVPALAELNLQIKAGEKIGIVGRTGSGKSTFATSLFRMLEASEGTILIDNKGISNLIRHRFSWIENIAIQNGNHPSRSRPIFWHDSFEPRHGECLYG
jgi:ABC-type multidrug transport system fused ATPase/permease subunit